MLNTQGLFKSVPCPAYVTGHCLRSYCPFRHDTSDLTDSVRPATAAPDASKSTRSHHRAPQPYTPSRVTRSPAALPQQSTAPSPNKYIAAVQNDKQQRVKIKYEPTTESPPKQDDIGKSLAAVNAAIANLRQTMESHYSQSMSGANVVPSLGAMQAIQENVEQMAALEKQKAAALRQYSPQKQSSSGTDSVVYVPTVKEEPHDSAYECAESVLAETESNYSTGDYTPTSATAQETANYTPSEALVEPTADYVPRQTTSRPASSASYTPTGDHTTKPGEQYNPSGSKEVLIDMNEVLFGAQSGDDDSPCPTHSNSKGNSYRIPKKKKARLDDSALLPDVHADSATLPELEPAVEKSSEAPRKERQGVAFRTVLSKKTPASERPNAMSAREQMSERYKKTKAAKKETTERPVIAFESGGAVPSNVRQRYLNLIIDECLKFCDTAAMAYDKALECENSVHVRSSSKNSYLNSIAQTIKRLRENHDLGSSVEAYVDPSEAKPTVSHQSMLVGPKANFTVNRRGGKMEDSALADINEFHDYITQNYLLTEDELALHGFPRPDPQNSRAAVFHKEEVNKKLVDDETLLRVCCRCGKQFELNVAMEPADVESGTVGFLDEDEETGCLHHWGKPWKRKVNGAIETRFNCCQSDLSVKGCSFAQAHVTEQIRHKSLTRGWLNTASDSRAEPDRRLLVAAIDCEMVYTLGGSELGRLSVVDWQGNGVLDTLVRPSRPLLDANTRFSGLKRADLRNAPTTLKQVQKRLLELIDGETVLIGHGLDTDMRALKIIHSCVVDTTLLFPHRLGLPYKRGLKTLAGEFLSKIIQDDESGHDSTEDAACAAQLVRYKVAQDHRHR